MTQYLDQGGAVYNINAYAGTAHQKFEAADNAADGKGTVLIPKGEYPIDSNLAVLSHLRFERGALLKPTANVTIMFNGSVEAGAYQIFDAAPGRIIRPDQYTLRNDVVRPEWWWAETGDVGPAINAALAFFNGGPGVVQFGPRLYPLTAGSPAVLISHNGQWLQGAAKGTTRFEYTVNAGAGPSVAIKLDSGSSVSLYGAGVRNISIYSPNTTEQKIAVQLVNTTECVVEGLAVGDRANWYGGTGDGSIGLHLKGRDHTTVRDLTVFADTPVYLGLNPHLSLSCDHLHVEDAYLVAQPQFPCIYVDGGSHLAYGMYLSNVTFDGRQSWNGGAHGFLWQQVDPSETSHEVRFENVRWEQSTNAAGYGIKIDSPVIDLGIDLRCGNNADHNGIHLRRCTNVIVKGYFAGKTIPGRTPVALDIDNCTQVTRIGHQVYPGSAIIIGPTMQPVFETPRAVELEPGGGVVAVYEPTVATYERLLPYRGTLRYGGEIGVGGSFSFLSAGADRPAIIHAVAQGTSISAGATWIATLHGVTKIAGTTNTSDVSSAGKLSLSREPTSNSLILQNGLGASVTFVLTVSNA
jgi:hypothetical protein